MADKSPNPLVEKIDAKNVAIIQKAGQVETDKAVIGAVQQLVVKKGDRTRIIPRMAPIHQHLLVGRKDMLEELRKKLCLQDPDNSSTLVIALWGMGGVGKSALAMTFANLPETESALPAGTLWASFGPEPDVMAILAEWGNQLGEDLTEFPSAEARSRALQSLLHKREILIVLDDVWQTDHARHMLVGGPTSRMVITTRDANIARALAGVNIIPLGVLTESASFELLESLAPEPIAADSQGAGLLAKQLGYLPLGLIIAGRLLAAEWTAGLGTRGLLYELEERESRLEMSSETPSLAAILGASYNRLPDKSSQQAFRTLGVFGGKPNTFSIEAVTRMWEMKARLAQKTMILLVNRALAEPTTNGRYTLHALLADYAASLLDQGEELEAHRKHAGYFFEIARQYTSANMEAWGEMDVDWDNIHLAANWLSGHVISHSVVEKNEMELMAEYAFALDIIIQTRKPSGCQKWLEAGKIAFHKTGRIVDEAWLLNTQGQIALDRGQTDKSAECFIESASLFEMLGEQGDPNGLVYARGNLGTIHTIKGEYLDAISYFEQANQLCEDLNDKYGLAVGHYNLANIHHKLEDVMQSLSHLQKSIQLSRDEGVSDLLSKGLSLLAKLLHTQGDNTKALEMVQEACDIAARSNSLYLSGIATCVKGEILGPIDAKKADECYRQGIQWLVDANVVEELAEAKLSYGNFLITINRKVEAISEWEAAIQGFKQISAFSRVQKITEKIRASS